MGGLDITEQGTEGSPLAHMSLPVSSTINRNIRSREEGAGRGGNNFKGVGDSVPFPLSR